MKFRGKMVDISSIQHFTRILNTIARMTKTAIIRILPTHIYLIFNERITAGGSSLWCEIPQDHYFCEFNMEGLSEEHNEIYLEFQVDNLVTAYRSAQAAKSVKLKLTKKHVPCLTLEVELPSLHSHSRFVVHDVPVVVIPRRLWEQFQEPSMIQFDVSLYMPSLKVIRNVVERMKNIGTIMFAFYLTNMKFRGKMVDISSIQHFTRILNTIARMTKTAIIRILPTHIYLIFNERITAGGSSLWCEIPQDHYFCEFNMEGLSEEHNEIYLEFQVDNLVTAYRSAQAAKSVKLKLTKKHVPCLTLEVELPSLHSHSRFVVHDVPVVVIPRRLWEQFQEPSMIQFDVSLYMPSLKVIRNVVERMKNIGTIMTMFATSEGEFDLRCETDIVTITTHFKDLNLTSVAASTTDGKQTAECRIDIKKFNQFLLGQQINPAKVVCNILNNQMVQFFLLHDDVSIQYFLPCIVA